jgi:hypothetical protein
MIGALQTALLEHARDLGPIMDAEQFNNSRFESNILEAMINNVEDKNFKFFVLRFSRQLTEEKSISVTVKAEFDQQTEINLLAGKFKKQWMSMYKGDADNKCEEQRNESMEKAIKRAKKTLMISILHVQLQIFLKYPAVMNEKNFFSLLNETVEVSNFLNDSTVIIRTQCFILPTSDPIAANSNFLRDIMRLKLTKSFLSNNVFCHFIAYHKYHTINPSR